MTNDNLNRLTRLQELSDSDYEIAEGQPDISNWIVTDEEGRVIGHVQDLLFDTQSSKVRYIILEVESSELNLDSRQVLIPIGVARIHEENDHVILPGITVYKLNALPDYIHGDVNPGVENLVRHILSDGNGTEDGSTLTGHPLGDADTDFYSHHHFDDDAFYQPRKDKLETTQTVVGLFDDGMEAENAVRELVASGFTQDNIDLSSSNLNKTVINPQNPNDLTIGITNFINISISREEDEPESAIAGSVVTVKCSSEEEVHRATSILDKCGAVEVSESA